MELFLSDKRVTVKDKQSIAPNCDWVELYFVTSDINRVISSPSMASNRSCTSDYIFSEYGFYALQHYKVLYSKFIFDKDKSYFEVEFRGKLSNGAELIVYFNGAPKMCDKYLTPWIL